MQGLHLTADLHDCQCELGLLIRETVLADRCRVAVGRAGLTLVDEKYFVFPDYQGQPGGVTGAVLLAESHLAVHTWPEQRAVTLDVYVCNFSTDNSDRARRLLTELIEAFQPGAQVLNQILRGDATDTAQSIVGTQAMVDAPMLEWLNADCVYGFRSTRLLEATQSRYQAIEVHESAQWGRLFRLDGCFMTSERDEFHYHESLVHPAAITHPAPRSALVIGGGDGGSTEELLKHPSIERVVMAELDPEVIRIARQYLGEIHRGALDDPRLEIRLGDGWAIAESIARAGQERFDLILLDLTDPDTPAFKLYSEAFFRMARQILNPGGALVMHIGSPVYKPTRVQALLRSLGSSFPIVRPMGLYIPLYGAYWGLAVASDTLDPCAIRAETVSERLNHRGITRLEFYNEATHQALFALPNYYRRLLPG
ncbi:MAG: polyamine aminopropyltransferase [Pseudomonadota bacterium]|jgi:spermidine synthase